MRIIGGLDVHRSQITYDWIDTDSGQRQRGQLAPAHREHLRVWPEQFAGQEATFALEGCTGWRYVVEELQRAGIAAHLAEPADTSTLRGPSGTPRPTGPTPGTCADCWPQGGCPSPGSRRRTCWRPAPRCAATRR